LTPGRILRYPTGFRFTCAAAAAAALFASACASTGTLDRRQFEGVRRAGEAIRDSIAKRTPLPRYAELLAQYSSELSVLSARSMTSEERAIAERYRTIHDQLQDLRLVWEARSSQAAETDRLPLSEPLPARLAKQYSLPINTNDPPSIYATEALEAIWSAAKAALEEANAATTRSGEPAAR
jgi:hypothetical protein